MENLISAEENQVQKQFLPFRLIEGIELLNGLNSTPMLYIAERNKYVRLSPLGADIINILSDHQSVTSSDIIHVLVERYPRKSGEVQQKVMIFLLQLENIGVIKFSTGGGEGEQGREAGLKKNIIRYLVEHPVLRVDLWHPDRPLAQALVRPFRESPPGPIIKSLFCAFLFLACSIAGYNVVHLGLSADTGLVSWPLVIAIFIIHIIFHETSHICVNSYYDVKIRAVGVGLLYYLFPVFYVDRTDSYRLQRAKSHVYISLAGPAFDISATAVCSTIAVVTTGWVKASFQILSLLQIATFISNINPLFPSDGYRAFEYGLKGLNFRRRAFTILFYTIIHKELPSYLKDLSYKKRFYYYAYGILAFAWMIFIVFFFMKWIVFKI